MRCDRSSYLPNRLYWRRISQLFLTCRALNAANFRRQVLQCMLPEHGMRARCQLPVICNVADKRPHPLQWDRSSSVNAPHSLRCCPSAALTLIHHRRLHLLRLRGACGALACFCASLQAACHQPCSCRPRTIQGPFSELVVWDQDNACERSRVGLRYVLVGCSLGGDKCAEASEKRCLHSARVLSAPAAALHCRSVVSSVTQSVMQARCGVRCYLRSCT